MSITLHLYMVIPGILTLILLCLIVGRSLSEPGLDSSDIQLLLFIYAVLMIVSGLSVWTSYISGRTC